MAGQIEALLHELERHILAGRDERVAAIKRELAALGHKSEDEPSVVETTSAPAAPENTAAPRPTTN